VPNAAVLDVIDDVTRATVLGAGTLRRYSKGSWLFHEADPAKRVWALTGGVIKVQKISEGGRVSVLGFREAGCLLGEQSALDGAPMLAGAVALTDAEAVVITRQKFMEILADSPALSTALLQQMNRRLRQAATLLHDISTADAVTRVANRLMDLTAHAAEPALTPAKVKLPVSQQDLAEWSGLSREAVVRALRVLRDEGIIETGRLAVTVMDPARLAGRGYIDL
jgi:CRP/FNR family transcriptional regulator, cyclic AMP receptor protein